MTLGSSQPQLSRCQGSERRRLEADRVAGPVVGLQRPEAGRGLAVAVGIEVVGAQVVGVLVGEDADAAVLRHHDVRAGRDARGYRVSRGHGRRMRPDGGFAVEACGSSRIGAVFLAVAGMDDPQAVDHAIAVEVVVGPVKAGDGVADGVDGIQGILHQRPRLLPAPGIAPSRQAAGSRSERAPGHWSAPYHQVECGTCSQPMTSPLIVYCPSDMS